MLIMKVFTEICFFSSVKLMIFKTSVNLHNSLPARSPLVNQMQETYAYIQKLKIHLQEAVFRCNITAKLFLLVQNLRCFPK